MAGPDPRPGQGCDAGDGVVGASRKADKRVFSASICIFISIFNRGVASVFPALLPTYNRTDVAFVRGEGSYLFAEDGKRYLDFGAVNARNPFCHAHPRLAQVLTQRAGTPLRTTHPFPCAARRQTLPQPPFH